jgi:glycosyltransferase involved in cell wall biosynthesis
MLSENTKNNISSPTDVTLVIACYNEESHLLRSVKEIEEVMAQTAYMWEFLFIDDCSKDGTRDVIRQICETRENARALFHEKNRGRGASVKEGLLMARTKYAGFLDIDLEVHARYIPSMMLALEGNVDMATGLRYYDHLQVGSLSRAFTSLVYRKIVKYYLGVNFGDTETGYKFFSLDSMRDVIKETENPHWFWDTEIVVRALRAEKKVVEIPCLFLRNKQKKSTVRLLPDIIAQLRAVRALR